MITKDYNNPKTITIISELNIGQWVRNRVTESTRCIAAGSILTSHLFKKIIIRPIIFFVLFVVRLKFIPSINQSLAPGTKSL